MLRGKNIILRPIKQEDLETLERWESDPDFIGEFNNFGLHGHGSQTRAFAEGGMLSDRSGLLVITTLEGVLVGSVSYHMTGYGPNQGSKSYGSVAKNFERRKWSQ